MEAALVLVALGKDSVDGCLRMVTAAGLDWLFFGILDATNRGIHI